MPFLSTTAPTEASLGAASVQQPLTCLILPAAPPWHSLYWVCRLHFSNLVFCYTKKSLLSLRQTRSPKPSLGSQRGCHSLKQTCAIRSLLPRHFQELCSEHSAVRDLLPLAPVQVQHSLVTARTTPQRLCWQDSILSPMYPSGAWC